MSLVRCPKTMEARLDSDEQNVQQPVRLLIELLIVCERQQPDRSLYSF